MSSTPTASALADVSGTPITFETGRLAKQASGAVVVRQGETVVLSTATMGSLRDTDIDDEGGVLGYSASGTLVERIRTTTKEVEVGDRFTGKVVKTTTFGAFVELAKGTDGLLHISDISSCERVSAVEDVVKRGEEIAVTVVHVDRERGRIGLRRTDDPSIEGKSSDELRAIGTGSVDSGGSGQS